MDRLKGKTILIGKEPGQGRLLIAVKDCGKTAAIGAPDSVPASVSRLKVAEGVAHAELNIDAGGRMTLANLKPENVTYVNGSEIASKRITEDSLVSLGRQHFAISVPTVLEAAKKIVAGIQASQGGQTVQTGQTGTGGQVPQFNIAHLRGVWERYETEMDRIVQQQQDMSRKRMLPIMIGSSSSIIAALGAMVAISSLVITLPLGAVCFYLYYRNYRKKDTSYEDRKKATEEFQDEYVCPNPNCCKFLGNYSYKLLQKQYSMHCPYCKCEYVIK